MENTRPKYTDHADFANVKKWYFKDNRPINEDLDNLERLERQESKYRNNNKSSR